jgi:hypothetical protein
VPDSGVYRNKQCEFAARNDAPVFSSVFQGRHEHQWSIATFAQSRPFLPSQNHLLDEFSRFVCVANLSLAQAVHEETRHFCNTIIEYGFRLGQSSPTGQIIPDDTLPKVTVSQLRARILASDASNVHELLQNFQTGDVHLSIDAGTIHGNSVLDFILLRSLPGALAMDYGLFESTESPTSTQKFYMDRTLDVIQRLSTAGIRIRSIVGDGFSSQLLGLSPSSETSIQNTAEYIARCPSVENMFYIYCSCHLLNLALKDAIHLWSFLTACHDSILVIASSLRKKQNVRLIKRRCPRYSLTRWCHEYLLCADTPNPI